MTAPSSHPLVTAFAMLLQYGNSLCDPMQAMARKYTYCITSEIDVLVLRQFQSSHRPPDTPFKPVPDGFNQDMAHGRKVLPRGKQA